MPPNMVKAHEEDNSSDDDEKMSKGKSRRELPAGAVATLKAWLLSPEHFTHPYPTPQDQAMLMQKTGIDKKQLKNWFTNARRRIWKPMLKKQMEAGTLQLPPGALTGAPGAAPPVPAVVPPAPEATTVSASSADSAQPQYDAFGNPLYPTHPGAPAAQQQAYGQAYQSQDGMPTSGSIGSLPPMSNAGSFSGMMSKHDSHAVLMELFQRDQDLVRQASESRKKGGLDPLNPSGISQGSLKFGSSSLLANVPSLSSWPKFSSISSLNNLGSMTGVKSITSLSGVDLASQGKSGNLAQVKSLESMGKHDSYAFLEVFFGDRASSTNLSAKDSDLGSRGVKREREEDNDVGLSLDADESPSTSMGIKQNVENVETGNAGGSPLQAPPILTMPLKNESGTTLKGAYNDALAARGLLSVSRSSERLTDLVLPAKMQRTLSQEFIRQQQATLDANQYLYSAPLVASIATKPGDDTQQYAGAGQPTQETEQNATSDDDPNNNSSVEVPNATKCDLCHSTDVDTQLNPCGHYFHHRCLKPSLQTPMGQPKCPIDNISIQSALLAIPTEENETQNVPQPPPATTSWATSPPVSTNPAIPADVSSGGGGGGDHA